MKNIIVKMFVAVVVFSVTVILSASALAYMPPESKSKNKAASIGSTRPEFAPVLGFRIGEGSMGAGVPEYVPGKILLKIKEFKNETDIPNVISKAGLKLKDFRRSRSTKYLENSYIAGLKNTKGQYQFEGKVYTDRANMPKERILAAALSKLPKVQGEIYKWYTIALNPEKETKKQIDRAVRALKRNPVVADAQPDYIVSAQMVPNDPMYSQQWAHQNMGSEAAWDLAAGGSDVVVAIVDTGVDYNHEDLAANMWHNPGETPNNGIDDDGNGWIDDVYGYDFFNADSDPKDDFGHGTHCAGIAGAVINNVPTPLGIAGVCPTAKIMAVKCLGSNGEGTLDGCASGIFYAAVNGAKVISMSWGGRTGPSYLQDIVNYALSQGCILVAAAGNSNADVADFCPANCQNVIAVGAIDVANNKAGFSNFGSKVDVAAPGVNILSTMPQYHVTLNDYGFAQNYANMTGTSMACPQVAGEVALLLSKYPGYTRDKITNMIRAGTTPDIISEEYAGTGRISLSGAFSKDSPYFDTAAARIDNPVYNTPQFPPTIAVSGTAVGASYALDYSRSASPYSAVWAQFAQGSTVLNGALGDFPCSSIEDGKYFIKLKVTDAGGYELTHMTKLYLDKNAIPGWPQQTDGGHIDSSPVCADFDHDGRKELFAMNLNDGGGTTKAYLWRSDATLVPGWPKVIPVPVGIDSTSVYFYSTPTVADLDNDGDLEIVFSALAVPDPNMSSGIPIIYAWHHDGSAVTGWPKIMQFPSGIIMGYVSGVAIGDVNGDGNPEIVATIEWGEDGDRLPPGTRYATFEVYVFDKNGNILSSTSYPHVDIAYWFRYFNLSVPSLADINNDGRKDIVFAYYDSSLLNCVINVLDGSTASQLAGWPKVLPVFALNNGPLAISIGDVDHDGNKEMFFAGRVIFISGINKDGNTLPGWPRSVYGFSSSLSLAYLNNDNNLEIMARDGFLGNAYVFDRAGDALPGWPKQIDSLIPGWSFLPYFSSPVAGDIDGDGIQDIVMSKEGGRKLCAFDFAGNVKTGFPKILSEDPYRYVCTATPSLVDFDNDGRTEVITADVSGKVWAWKFGKFDATKMEWSVEGSDLARTYSCVKPRILNISPPAGKANDNVQIIGSDFGGDGQVNFGTVNSWSDSSINVKVPDLGGMGGNYPVTVTTAKGISNSVNFYYLAPPHLAFVRPDSGLPGSTVQLFGVNFANPGFVPVIKFGDVKAEIKNPPGYGDAMIYCLVPEVTHPGVYPVTVTNSVGTSNSVNFTGVIPPPYIQSAVVPPVGGIIDIRGSNFGKDKGKVQMRTLFPEVMPPWTDKKIIIKKPAVRGRYPVQVITGSGIRSNEFYVDVK